MGVDWKNERPLLIGHLPNGRPVMGIGGGDGTDGTAAGATPGAGATPPTPPVGQPPAGATPPAAGTPPVVDDAALGDAGKLVLQQARREAKEARDSAAALQKQIDDLKAAGQTEAEKALNDAIKKATNDTDAKWAGIVRAAEVRRALTAAGIAESEVGLAALDPAFASLKVNDEGTFDKLPDTVAAFKTAHPALFGQPTGGPDYGGGRRGGASTLTRDQIERMSTDEINNRWAEVQQVLSTTR